MKQSALIFLLVMMGGCDSKNETVNQGRKAVKEVITQPFDALNSAKDSLQESQDKQKAALEEADKANQ